MPYQFIKEKLDKNQIVILDGGNGGELEQIGAKMDKDLWQVEVQLMIQISFFKFMKII